MEVLHLANMQMTNATDKLNELDLKNLLSNPYLVAEKTNSPLITHSGCESKSKEHILAHNKQEILSIDIDEGNYTTISEVESDIEKLGITSFCVYTTASHNPPEGKYKFRAIIPLDAPISCAEFTITQTALCVLFKSDDVVARIQQILFLPMASDHYQYIDKLIGRGFCIEQSPKIMSEIVRLNEERMQQEKEKEAELKLLSAKRETRRAQIASSSREQLVSVFDECEKGTDMHNLLQQYGFKRKGARYLHPNSSSGLAGVVVMSDGSYFSHHSEESDPLANGKSHSCFDLIKYWEFDNDQDAAIKGLSDELMINGMSLTEHNNAIKKGNHANEIQRHNDEMHCNLRAIAERAIEKAEAEAVNALYADDEPGELFTQPESEQEGAVEEAVQTQAIASLNSTALDIDVDSDEIINFDIRENIMPTKRMNFDMLRPTGIVERIIEEICIRMHRSDQALAVAPALYIAMRAGLPTINNSRLNPDYDIKQYGVGLNGFKIYLNLLTVGISASGKDKPQQLLNSTLSFLGDESYGRIASDKDLAISLIDSMGSSCCVIDEAGGMFNSIQNGKSDYIKNLAGAMMQFATSKHSNFDGLIKRGLKKDYQVSLGNLVRSLDKIDEQDESKEAFIRDCINKEIKLTEWKISACQDGIAMPQFAILASSTPTDMRGAISLETLNTGQMSRYLIFVGKSDVDPIREKVEGIDYDNLPDEILQKLWWTKSNAHVADKYELMRNAQNTYDYIFKWFESRRNHTEFSVLYRRGFESVVRLASILSVQDRIVTIAHLEWAFCLVRANIESFVITCASQSETTTNETKLEIAILSALKSARSGLYMSVLKQRLSRKNEWFEVMPFFEKCVESLINNGFAAKENSKLVFTGKNSIDKV